MIWTSAYLVNSPRILRIMNSGDDDDDDDDYSCDDDDNDGEGEKDAIPRRCSLERELSSFPPSPADPLCAQSLCTTSFVCFVSFVWLSA